MLDTFGRNITYLRLSVTDMCNLRCRYCMPSEGVCKKQHYEMLTEDEMIMAVKAASSLGINKLRLTGGEPLVKKNIISICERSAAIPEITELCLTTNGILLSKMAQQLYNAGVSRLNISLDTLNVDKYEYITRIGNLNQVLHGIEAAMNAGFSQLKINSVLIGGFNTDEIPALAALTQKYSVDVRFIELMPMTIREEFEQDAYVSGNTVLSALPDLSEVVHDDGGVARLYRLPDAKGNIGIISAVSQHFCSSCNRIRLTADGKLKPCLHSEQEYSIKGLDYTGMRHEIEQTILSKPPCHVALSYSERSKAGRNMNQIGG